jgi:hypothetical protein
MDREGKVTTQQNILSRENKDISHNPLFEKYFNELPLKQNDPEFVRKFSLMIAYTSQIDNPFDIDVLST